jgi:hypothetical protein
VKYVTDETVALDAKFVLLTSDMISALNGLLNGLSGFVVSLLALIAVKVRLLLLLGSMDCFICFCGLKLPLP